MTCCITLLCHGRDIVTKWIWTVHFTILLYSPCSANFCEFWNTWLCRHQILWKLICGLQCSETAVLPLLINLICCGMWLCVCAKCCRYCTACLPVLHTLQITHNRLQSVTDIEHLVHCHSIGVLDLSHNQLDEPLILDVFKRMNSLVSCYLWYFYVTAIRSLLEYACLAWHTSLNQEHSRQLENIQKWAVNNICGHVD